MNRSTYLLRVGCVFIALLVSFGFLVRHLYFLQVRDHPRLYSKARSTYTASKTLVGRRGGIYDRNGNPLTGNLECKDVRLNLNSIPNNPQYRSYLVGLLSKALEVNPHVLTSRLNSNADEVVIKNQVDRKLAKRLEDLRIPGTRYLDRPKRYYPKGQLLANVLGFTDYQNNGVFGLEASLDRELKSTKIEHKYERDRKGYLIKSDAEKTSLVADGNSVYITIDEPIQHFVETEIKQLVTEFAPKSAYGIMVNPKTGAILAMAQYPSFDPNDRTRLSSDSWRNRMISDVYDPGSTMKCIAIAGALDYGIVTLNTRIDCERGIWHYANRELHDAGHQYDELSVAEIVQKSSNIGTAKIALKIGEKRLYQILKRFGFGSKTGINLNNESAGILRHPRDWDRLSITRFPIGQGISVTPLQMVQAYCGLGNQGKMMQLYLVDRVVNSRTGEVVITKPTIKCHTLRSRAAEDILTAMSLVTDEEGTAPLANIPGYVIAGKTGTSQKLVNGSYSGHGKYISSFIGLVPANDPEIVLLVVVDEPSGDQFYGGTVAAPAFQRIAHRTLRYLNIPPASSHAFNQGEYVKND